MTGADAAGRARAGGKAARLLRRGLKARERGRYEDALRWHRTALALAERRVGDGSDLVPYLIGLGVACKYAARFTEGEAAYRRALALLEATAEPDLMALATVHHNLGGLFHAMGDHAAAEPYAARSVELRTAALGADDPTTAADLAALAAIIDARARHREAEALLRRVITAFETAYGPHHYEVAVNLNNLGACLAAQHDVAAAEMAYRRALAIKELVLSPAHPELATTLNNLAVLRKGQGDYVEAAALYARTLRIVEVTLAPTHPILMRCRSNEARLHKGMQTTEVEGTGRVRAVHAGCATRCSSELPCLDLTSESG